MPQATSLVNWPIRRARRYGRTGARMALFLCLLVVGGFVAARAVGTLRERQAARQSDADTVAAYGLTTGGAKHLAAKFTDKEGHLVADAPAVPAQLVNPDTIVVAHIAGADETPGMSWADWEKRLSRRIGKNVIDQIYTNSADQVVAAASGTVTLLALHAADAPFLVNNYGFQPLAVLGSQGRIDGNRLDLIVPANSPIAAPANIKGHRLVCTVPSSITGYRAGIAMLVQESSLRPNTDYEVIFSLGQKRSITGIAEKQYEVAAVSDDKLQSLLRDGTIDSSQIKVIYQSPVIPRTTIGCFYNLDPALRDQLRQAILAIDEASAAVATSHPATSRPSALQFMAVDYKRDFQFVRNMDDLFDPRFDAQAARKSEKTAD